MVTVVNAATQVPLPAGGTAAGSLRVLGLCAAWCGVCREFAPQFAQFAANHPRLATAWLDVEDATISAALGDVDVETFPTVAIGRGDSLLFWGEILPNAAMLERLSTELAQQHQPAATVLPVHQQAWLALLGLPNLQPQ